MGFDLRDLIETVGLIGIFIMVFAESGLLVGIMLPGDSLLFTAGFMASQDLLSFPALVVVVVLAATSGDATGYWFGRRVGRKLYTRPNSRFFKQHHLQAAERFYEKHGWKAIILARFVPFARTLAPIIAGTTAMDYRKFTTFNIMGGIGWGVGVTTGGYLLGETIPDPDKYLLPVIALVIVISLMPTFIHVLRENRGRLRLALRERKLPWNVVMPEAPGGDGATGGPAT